MKIHVILAPARHKSCIRNCLRYKSRVNVIALMTDQQLLEFLLCNKIGNEIKGHQL